MDLAWAPNLAHIFIGLKWTNINSLCNQVRKCGIDYHGVLVPYWFPVPGFICVLWCCRASSKDMDTKSILGCL